jgi:ADP-ribose pyrophosphatase YjhB (NUDIX family)
MPADARNEQEFLKHYNIHDFDVPLVSIDVAIFTLIENQLKVLLVQRNEHPHKGRWSLPGGFIDVAGDRDLTAAAIRKLREKTGVKTPYVEQVASVGGPDRDLRGWSVTILHMALIPYTTTANFVASVSDARWWSIDAALATRLAFDHRHLLELARDRLRNKTAYTALPIQLISSPFTLTELQRAFEALIGTPLEKKAFRRRIASAELLEEVSQTVEGSRGRPAALFKPRKGFENHLFRRVFGEANE